MKRIFVILFIAISFGCNRSSTPDHSGQGGQQESSSPPQSMGGSPQATGGVSGANSGTGGIDPETPGGASIEPYRPCATRPCSQRLSDTETEEDLKYSLPR